MGLELQLDKGKAWQNRVFVTGGFGFTKSLYLSIMSAISSCERIFLVTLMGDRAARQFV